MVRTYEGAFDAHAMRIAVVAGRFNETISRWLVEGALDCLRRHGVNDDDISLAWVPGAMELPATAKRLAASGEVDAVVCVGVVIRGGTPHFDYVAGGAAQGIVDAGLETGVPITFGVLTTDTSEQAAERAGGKLGNKGFDAALAAIEMVSLFSSLPK
jgi:6,7-dimethyl-8-ribityllumazine synthase